jgi:hypothetical protein
MTNEPKAPKGKEKITVEESAASVQRVIERIKREPFEEEETRGVKKGTKRGPYQPRRKGVIKDKNFITNHCKQCRQEFTYKRKGKRLKKFCSDACRQKHYRIVKKQKKLEKQMKYLAT